MATKKFNIELPGDMVGQKTTAVPTANVAQAEWVTPIYVTGSNGSIPVTVTFPSTQNVSDTTARTSLSSIDTKLSGTLNVADATARTSLAAIDTKLGGTINVSDSTARTSLSAIDTKLGGTIKTNDSLVLTEIQNLKTEMQAVRTKVEGVLSTQIVQSDVMVPTEIQGNYQTTNQFFNNVTIAPSAQQSSTWIDTNGFTDVAITLLCSVQSKMTLEVDWSNDGITKHGYEGIYADAVVTRRAAITSTKARYVMVTVKNGDVAPVIVNTFTYLKA